jgi:two-component system OmpR family sensor kinase
VFATYLVHRAEGRRIMDAAMVLAVELDHAAQAHMSVSDIVADEDREMSHTGIAFAVFDANTGARVAGDPGVPLVRGALCVVSNAVHACGTPTARGLRVSAATGYTQLASLLAVSSALAALLAGGGAWVASRPVASLLIGPLSELRERVGSIDVAKGGHPDLGSSHGIVEVDALRETIRGLLNRIGDAVRHAERFAADAAHELRTPLTTIRGELELLAEDKSLTPTAVADLTRARRKVVDLQTLVERLLVLALPDQSQWSASELVSLQDLVEDIIAQLPAPDRQRVKLGAPRGDAIVRGDTTLLGILFSNALSNALKFGRTVSVAAFEDGEDAVLLIGDDGPGVPPDRREHVFEAFVRVVAASQPHVPGHGLGLALISHVARRHGGSAKFIDGPSGAHLEVRLPRCHSAVRSGPAPERRR